MTKTWEQQEAVYSSGGRGLFDSDVRVKDLEAEGVVAEVLFPQRPAVRPVTAPRPA